jgi:hypothetical protein
VSNGETDAYQYRKGSTMTTTRRALFVGGLMAGSLILVPAAAFASDNYNPPSQIPTTAQCGTGAGSGSFGAFGQDYNFAGGANGYQTGLNNSAVCGNRQGDR